MPSYSELAMEDLACTPEAYAYLKKRAEDADRIIADLKAKTSRIDLSDENRLRRLRRRADRMGLSIDKGKGQAWPCDGRDLGGLMVFEMLHILASDQMQVDISKTSWGTNYDLNYEDVEVILDKFEAKHGRLDAEGLRLAKIAKRLGGFGRYRGDA